MSGYTEPAAGWADGWISYADLSGQTFGDRTPVRYRMRATRGRCEYDFAETVQLPVTDRTIDTVALLTSAGVLLCLAPVPLAHAGDAVLLEVKVGVAL